MQAVGDVLKKYGASKLGVEAVATEAGMDKAMLYRHYKDFNEILKHYIEQEDFWLKFLTVKQHTQVNNDNVVEIVNNFLSSQFKELLRNNKFQQLLKWELFDTSGMMKNVAQKREDLAIEMLKAIENLFPYEDISSNNLIAVISAGIYYLVLHKDISTFGTIDLNNFEHQKKFITDLHWLIEKVFSPINETEQIALNCFEKGFNSKLTSELTGLNIERVKKLEQLYNQ